MSPPMPLFHLWWLEKKLNQILIQYCLNFQIKLRQSGDVYLQSLLKILKPQNLLFRINVKFFMISYRLKKYNYCFPLLVNVLFI